VKKDGNGLSPSLQVSLDGNRVLIRPYGCDISSYTIAGNPTEHIPIGSIQEIDISGYKYLLVNNRI